MGLLFNIILQSTFLTFIQAISAKSMMYLFALSFSSLISMHGGAGKEKKGQKCSGPCKYTRDEQPALLSAKKFRLNCFAFERRRVTGLR